jgi:hypothetical protein
MMHPAAKTEQNNLRQIICSQSATLRGIKTLLRMRRVPLLQTMPA